MAEFDVVIKGGTVVDGTRRPRFQGDVGVKNGRVAAIGALKSGDADRVIDASGQIVAPGFVDLHTHLDGQIFWDPYCTTGGWHGVTSVVLGNCGFGFAPCTPEFRDRSMLMMSRNEAIPYPSLKAGMPWDWESFPEFMDSLDRTPKGVNCISYMPLTPLMIYVMGLEGSKSGRDPTEAETREMQRLLAEAMRAGACGWSAQRAGQDSQQGDYDGTPMPTDLMGDELCLALGDVLANFRNTAIQITANRNEKADAPGEDSGQQGGIRRLADYSHPAYKFLEVLAERSGASVIFNAIGSVTGRPEVHKAALDWLDDCNARGLKIVGQGITFRPFMQYSLDNFAGADFSPAWKEALHGSTQEQLAKLANSDLRARMTADAEIVSTRLNFEGLTVTYVGDRPELKRYLERPLTEIAAEQGKTPCEALIDLSVDSGLEAQFHTPSLSPLGYDAQGTADLMHSPYIVPGPSDGGAHVKFTVGGTFGTDMLTWLVRDEEKLSLEEAHWHLSSLPAKSAGFLDRGELTVGAPADVVVYDLENLNVVPNMRYERANDFPAGEWRMVQRCEGMNYTLVNGEVTFEHGVCTDAVPGKLLRHGQG